MKLVLRDLESVPHLEIVKREMLKKLIVTGVSTDTRTLQPGNVFVALRGDTYDGHDYVKKAEDQGAVMAMVDRRNVAVSLPLMVVEDTTRALGSLAHVYRRKFAIPFIAVGGSNGKTTTKDMIAGVLSRKFNVLATAGNLNNQIGLPQTLFRLTGRHDLAVAEIGTNHPGEIEYLCSILDPTHGILTTIGQEHMEFFPTIEAVAMEEGALFRFLKKTRRSVAFVNADDRHIAAQARGLKKTIRYGIRSRTCDIRGHIKDISNHGCVSLAFGSRTGRKQTTVQLRTPGVHNALNAVAAASVGLTFGVREKDIAAALGDFQPAAKRMEIVTLGGITVMNDTYNANPDSMSAALKTLAEMKVTGKRIAVLGDMLELGEASEQLHQRVGREAEALDIDYVLTYGPEARHTHEAIQKGRSMWYEQKNVLAEYLSELVTPGDVVLVKGSRGMKMEDVVVFLQERLAPTSAVS